MVIEWIGCVSGRSSSTRQEEEEGNEFEKGNGGGTALPNHRSVEP